MNNLLPYLLQSTLCLSLFWLMFRMVMRKERFFGLTRMLLLTIVLLSAAIPFIQLPLPFQSPVRVELPSVFAPVEALGEAIPPANFGLTELTSTEISSAPTTVLSQAVPSIPQLLFYGYLVGCLIALLVLLRSLVSVLLLTRKARSIPMEGFRLLVVEREVPAFSFSRRVVLSQSDYGQHRLPLLAHEQAHIKLYHFYDLLLLEAAKMIYWFNPVIYWMAKELKEIHEFQADDYTLIHGIDATEYQLLIIQKGVGSQRFALANSFNHCQIKKRIAMMNKQKQGKVWSWKVVAFLPLLALLLMAFSRKAENGTSRGSGLLSIGQVFSTDSTKQWSEADFMSTRGYVTWKGPDLGYITKDGKAVTLQKPENPIYKQLSVQIDSRSQIWIGNHSNHLNWKEFQDSIRTYFDVDFATEWTKPYFQKWTVDGIETMIPKRFFEIESDQSTPPTDYQIFLNTIGNTILEIREKYSRKIYKSSYSMLNSENKRQIDVIVPLIAGFFKTPVTWKEIDFKVDSIAKASKNEERITFQADRMVTDNQKTTMLYLYKNAQLKFKDIEIKADYIELNRDSSYIIAKGTKDSTAAIVGKPILKLGKQEFTATEIRYNFKTKKGIIYNNSKSTEF